MTDTSIEYIPLSKLIPSPHNVRVVSPSKPADKELIAMIQALGVIQNLVVSPKGKQFEVHAGGRRLAALQYLQTENKIKGTYLVPCKVISPEDATTHSLAENQRVDMHPADQFAAYQTMIDEGKTEKEISGIFGVSLNQVKKRLKLARVAPELVQHFRAGKLSLEDIMAFTVSDDHDKQRACYMQLSFVSPHHIKRFLLGQAITTQDALVKFVGLKGYKKAGGTTTTDLFESITYINDHDLLETLAIDKLEAELKLVMTEGWKWGEVSLDQLHSYQSLEPELVNAPTAITDALSEKEKALEAVESNWTAESWEIYDQIEDDMAALEAQLNNYRVFTEFQKSVSGVCLSFSSDGTLIVERGLMKKEDMTLLRSQQSTSCDENSQAHSDDIADAVFESRALTQDLKHFKLQALQSVLMRDDDVAYDVLVFSIARSLLEKLGYWKQVLDVTIRAYDYSATEGIEATAAAEAISHQREALNTAWLLPESDADQFKAFRALSRSDKKKILSFCVAKSFDALDDNELTAAVTDMLSFNIADHWQPTKENYFSRLRKKGLLSIGSSQMGEQWEVDHAKFSKGQLVDLLDGHDGMKGWTPASIAEATAL